MSTVAIPSPNGTREIALREPRKWSEHPKPFRSRMVFAAAHVVADPLANNAPGSPAAIDWDATMRFRRHLSRFGFGIAEAMDTAQRNMGVDWPAAQELISRSAAQAADTGSRIASGAGTDHRPDATSTRQIVDAYSEQLEFVEEAGSEVILMASRQLAATATSAQDYRSVYDQVIERASRPVILHWLGPMFDPQLSGYWGSDDIAIATKTFVELVSDHADRIDGVKVSLLSAEHEIGLRGELPDDVRLYTGDDFNYPDLIRGTETHHSDALLGAFAAVAPAAAAALHALDCNDIATYDLEMNATLALSRHIFEAPTMFYKTGIAFLSWLCGHQDGFAMVGGLQSARGAIHLSRLFELANDAQLLPDPDLATRRLGSYLTVAGAQP
ncbi:dihydrodipicolinate synthase family protein [Ilumatobacter sp.]|uniref:dihydrodipicolinate synthase family protein n=1 Tax=Ilumatobacter sp. TaxID=1967498 RepID=UPI003C595FA5